MCIFLYNFSFSLHYECQFGEFLALIGSIEEFGGWDISKAIELAWIEGNVWRKYISFKQKTDTIIEYKYLVCKRIQGRVEVVRWEEGPNRSLNFKQLKKLCLSIEDVWEHRKISFFLKDNSNILSNAFVIGRHKQLGSSSQAQEMQKITAICPLDGSLQTFWLKQIIVPAEENGSILTYNYLTVNNITKKWKILGNQTSFRLSFEDEGDYMERSPENSKLAKIYHSNSIGKIKQKKSRSKTTFENPYFSRLDKNDIQIFQDVSTFEEQEKSFKINDFLEAGCLNDDSLNRAKSQQMKRLLVFTNLKALNFGGQDIGCLSEKEDLSNDITVNILDLSQSNDDLLKDCANFMEKCLKNNENTMICWCDSKKKTFKILVEYFTSYKKFSVDAAKKFLKISSSRELIRRKNSKQTLLSR